MRRSTSRSAHLRVKVELKVVERLRRILCVGEDDRGDCCEVWEWEIFVMALP